MDENNRNFILAIILSIGVLFAWQYFFVPKPHPGAGTPTEEQQQAEPGPPQPQGGGEVSPGGAPQPGAAVEATLTREEALAQSPRIAIDTPSLTGSIALKGGRIDDLTLKDYRETVEPTSPHVVLLSPAGGPHAYYTEHGFVAEAGKDLSVPGPDTIWQAKTGETLTPQSPVTLTYDNGKGLKFTRTISLDDKYMFTIDDSVANTGSDSVTLYPYALVSRHETPHVQGFYILHEGLIGVVDDGGLEEISYKKAIANPPATFKSQHGWLGITDKYWATVVIPEQGKAFDAKFAGTQSEGRDRFQTDYLMAPLSLAPGETGEAKGNVFAGAKEVHLVDGYAEKYGIPKFDLLIDWGWFYFLTKPMFFALDFFYKLVGNFGVAILIVTLCIKLVLFPLANKSYVSMSKMKKLGPEMQRIKERYEEDRARQQQAMMELYKKEKVNPASGCLPILVQIPDLLRALQGAVRHHRDAACAVLRLDQGSVGPRPHQRLQSVRADPVGPAAFPHDRRLAAHHGLHHVGADEAEPGAARSGAAEDFRLDAGVLHLPARLLPGRTRDLLGVEQHALGDPAIGDHVAPGG